MNCDDIIGAGIPKDCASINAPVGADKDLILVNYEDFDYAGTVDASNRETDDTNNNIDGLTAIKLKTGAKQYIFEGTDYSVIPSTTGEVKETGDMWYVHSIGFIVYSKRATDRKTLRALGNSRVIAITKDRSTGLYEIFGMEHGLKVGELSREYVGSENSNFYSVTIQTPDVAVVRESGLPELALSIEVAE